MSKNNFERFWNLLNNFEDSIIDGIKKEHKSFDFFYSQQNIEKESKIDKNKIDEILKIEDAVDNCEICSISEKKCKNFIGKGSLNPKIMIIQTYDYLDNSYIDFLKKWIEGINLSFSDDCYLANIVKCVSKDSIPPSKDEINECFSYLKYQIDVVNPRIIFALGKRAINGLGIDLKSIEDARGKIFKYKDIDVFCSYHPAEVLQNSSLKRPVWEELKNIKAFLG